MDMTATQEAMIDRAIASTHRLTGDGAGFAAMLNVVPPQFNLGSACVALGLCRATVAAATTHLKIECGVLTPHLHRAPVPRCPCWGYNGADG